MKEEVKEILEKPFATSKIKRRRMKDGEEFLYVGVSEYIRRLNEAFGYEWSFEIEGMRILMDEVVVLGKLTAEGITKMQYGSSGSWEEFFSLGDKIKAAGTDALKKCCSLFGLGLHLYDGNHQSGADDLPRNNETQHAVRDEGNGDGDGVSDGATRLTSRQLRAIHTIRRRLEMPEQELKEWSKKRYGRVVEYLSKRDASDLIKALSKDLKEDKNEDRK